MNAPRIAPFKTHNFPHAIVSRTPAGPSPWAIPRWQQSYPLLDAWLRRDHQKVQQGSVVSRGQQLLQQALVRTRMLLRTRWISPPAGLS